MNPYKHLGDYELISIAKAFCRDLSYFYAGWDYPESARRERAAQTHCERLSQRVSDELRRRGMRVAEGLTSLGLTPSEYAAREKARQ